MYYEDISQSSVKHGPGGKVFFSIAGNKFDDSDQIRPAKSTCYVDVLPGWQRPHNDILALCAALIFSGYCRSELELGFPVSTEFADTYSELINQTFKDVSPDLAPRGKGQRQSLAFSGGVDSCVALHLLPKDTISFFLHRAQPEGQQPGLYRDDAALRCCERVEASGRLVHAVSTDLEFIRSPVGFPTNYANAVPAILHADHYDLRSVNFGTVLESAFGLGKTRYKEWDTKYQQRTWVPIFGAAGLSLSLPTAGYSEIATARIAMIPEVAELAPQSCIRGTLEAPCGTCFKCFRKGLMEAANKSANLSPSFMEGFLGSREVKKRLLEVPLHHEIGMAYCTSRVGVEQVEAMQIIRSRLDRVAAYGDDLSFLERFYHPAVAAIDTNAQDHVIEVAARTTGMMTAEQEKNVQDWDIEPYLDEDNYKKGVADISALIASKDVEPERQPRNRKPKRWTRKVEKFLKK